MYKRILVPVDGSLTSILGLKEGIRLGKSQKARLRVVHVVDEFVLMSATSGSYMAGTIGDLMGELREAGKRIIENAEVLVRKSGLKVESSMLESMGSHASELIIREAKRWRADIIVMGTHGRRGIRRLVMGSDAEGVVSTAPVPVMLVRSNIAARRPRKRVSGRR
jgi:nucleotide-binding universal stress UspA family protein